ncbi:DUF664 domain-containing protein [Arthrobacter sp. NamB2]|uniref:mycothiol transferase n=1 Tax=Arthrobacter sp. NamB2 TaxID=2576035 RepID=UPI0010C95DF1|nr:DUF664 domain-containing protein [Arthrobacter sp. NamB2]
MGLCCAVGLGREDLNGRLPPSTVTLGGLLKHLALVEDDWIRMIFLCRDEKALQSWRSARWDEDPDWKFHRAANDYPEYRHT